MNDGLRQARASVRDWFERAHALGWLDEADLQRLDRLERGTPGDLFEVEETRPLVVALFGGTGVGKSSLLNRLAGEPIARTGLERPTSLEVTAYLHESVSLARLPDDLPLERLQVTRHANAGQRDLMWLDMPDIDSTEAGNRALALSWLPHVDLLVYVVSPERYRDDAGWRVLLERRHRHGWLFVMNHWDQGADAQVADLAGILRGAGFTEPVIMRTCCVPPECARRDELPRLLETLDALRGEHGQRELERLGHAARLRDLRAALRSAAERLGTEEQWTAVGEALDADLTKAEAEILEGMQWPIRDLAARLGPQGGSLVRRLLESRLGADAETPGSANDAPVGGASSGLQEQVSSTVWDPWASRKLDEAIDTLEVAMRRCGVSAAPLVEPLRAEAAEAGTLVVQQADESLRRGLARPGGRIRRALLRMTGLARWFLPAAALAWIAIHVIRGFYRGVTEQGAFLGLDFAVNAGLLILVAWFLPWLTHRALMPSIEETAHRALRAGLEEGLQRLGGRISAVLDRITAERAALAVESDRLRASLEPAPRGAVASDAAVVRLLSRSPDQAAARSES